MISPLLNSRSTLKIFHDCREDASALLHGHKVVLNHVWDSQIGHNALVELEGASHYQSSLEAVASIYSSGFSVPPFPESFDPESSPECLDYAASGVLPLFDIFEEVSERMGDIEGDAVLKRSENHLRYAKMNISEIPDVLSLRPGQPISGVLADFEDFAIFRLNLGGISGRAKRAKWINSVGVGDVVNLEIGDGGLSACRKFLHVQALGESRGAVIIDKFGTLHSIDPKSGPSPPRGVGNSLRGWDRR